jgi:hypothetical protein
MMTLSSQLPRSRFLLMPEARPAGPRGERPKVRRYRLARLRVNPQPAVLTSGPEHPKSASS